MSLGINHGALTYAFKMRGAYDYVPLLLTSARVEYQFDWKICQDIALALLKKRIVRDLHVQIPLEGQDFLIEIQDSEGNIRKAFRIEARYSEKMRVCYIAHQL